ncbi:MAG: Fic family protein [Gammaproteobacteria bacterium]|nr:MAG: Fic family protein [Gammaproteobacteria bacterium]
MNPQPRNYFSGLVTVFHGRRLPEKGVPVGYAALIEAYRLKVPLPRRLSAIGEHHRTVERDGWRILTPRHAPEPSLEGHLTFALKYEGLDLAVLKRLFEAAGADNIAAVVRSKPTGRYARRLWFLYEWLLGRELDLPGATRGGYVPVVDTAQQYGSRGSNVKRQRVRNNLPGTPEFCPLAFRTEVLDSFIAMDLPKRAQAVVADVPKDVVARTAAFLLLKDSKSSFAIEGEQPPQDRIQRWGRAIGEAGRNVTDFDELVRLQEMVIGDTRFVHIGLRTVGGFVGEHDRTTRMPLPDHISARPEDLPSLVTGMTAFEQGPGKDLAPVIEASILAFGFVYAHPFEDGNGRVHRYLIHHILSKRGFNPPGVVFPVSAAILEKIDEYRAVLEDYSKRLLPMIEWQPTGDGNLEVVNDTGDFYRFFDATPHAEFIYACVLQTIEHDLPEEARFLQRYDEFCAGLKTVVDMPTRTVDLLFRFLRQNNGKFSQRALSKEFVELTEREVGRIERLYADTLGRL